MIEESGAGPGTSVALDELDPDAVNPLDERKPHRCTARERERERPRLRRHLHVLRLERRNGAVDVQRTESDVVDRVTSARRGLTLRREQPDALLWRSVFCVNLPPRIDFLTKLPNSRS